MLPTTRAFPASELGRDQPLELANTARNTLRTAPGLAERASSSTLLIAENSALGEIPTLGTSPRVIWVSARDPPPGQWKCTGFHRSPGAGPPVKVAGSPQRAMPSPSFRECAQNFLRQCQPAAPADRDHNVVLSENRPIRGEKAVHLVMG